MGKRALKARTATADRGGRVLPFTFYIGRPTVASGTRQISHRPRLLLSLVMTLVASATAYAQQAELVTHPAIGKSMKSASRLPIDRGAQTPVAAARSQGCRQDVKAKLDRAFSISLDRVQTYPSCRALFARLGVDSAEILGSILYKRASSANEQMICRRATVAFTIVGRPATTLCRKFSGLADQKAAVLVLHEALHSSGLSERPHEPNGMSPADIDLMVARECGFTRK